MTMPRLTRHALMRWEVLLLSWLLLVTVIVGCVTREMVWQERMSMLDEVEHMIAKVAMASSQEEERDAMQVLSGWIQSERMTVSVSAYQRSDGTSIPVASVSGGDGSNMGFEVKFDMDSDHVPERGYQLALKRPQHIELLMRE